MFILAINTASSSTGIAFFEVKESATQNLEVTILAKNSWPAKNDEAEKLMPAIAKLLKNSHCKFSDIRQIYIVKGPGSFTGLRVGVTVANTLAYLNNCKLEASAKVLDTRRQKNFDHSVLSCTRGSKFSDNVVDSTFAEASLFGLTTFEYWHYASDLPVLIYAGSGGVYFSENPRSTAKLINLPDLNKRLEFKKIKSVTGDIPKTQIAILKNIKFIKPKKTFAQIMQTVIGKNFKKHNLKSVKIIQPLYIKEPGITESKKQLRNL